MSNIQALRETYRQLRLYGTLSADTTFEAWVKSLEVTSAQFAA